MQSIGSFKNFTQQTFVGTKKCLMGMAPSLVASVVSAVSTAIWQDSSLCKIAGGVGCTVGGGFMGC